MNRRQFKDFFNAPAPVVLPVIHVIDDEQAERNVAIAQEAGCPGVFLINHDFPYPQFLPIIRQVRERFQNYWIGINFLGVTGDIAFPILADLEHNGTKIDGYWADDARIDESSPADKQTEASNILQSKKQCGWNGLYFGGTAFKKQREVHSDHFHKSATIARNYMDVVTTSGIATGHAADLGKIETFRAACEDTSLALASGVTPENIVDYAFLLDAVLVATGINVKNDFYNIDASRLKQLMERCAQRGAETNT